MSDLTDSIDIEDTFPATLTDLNPTPSADIAEFAGAAADIGEKDLIAFINLKRAESAPQALDEEIQISKSIEDSVFNADEGLVYYTAFTFYTELAKRAKKFNKHYTSANGSILSVKRSLKSPELGLKYSKEFNPFLYTIYIRDKKQDDFQKRVLVQNLPTMEEAHIQAAYSLGFMHAEPYTSLLEKFHPQTMTKIINDERYLKAIRKRNQCSEESKQIMEATYVDSSKRKRWLLEVQEKIQNSLNKLEGAL